MGQANEAGLRSLWCSHFRPYSVPSPRALVAFDDLAARYAEPGRCYHTLDHVEDVLRQIDWGALADPSSPVAFACWFHDVIYDSRAKDNEERSADYASEVLRSLNVPAEDREETARLILLTRAHETTPDDTRGHELLDADLAILAADWEDYDAYAAAIRKEYAWVSEGDYRAGRRRVLERFLERERIYQTDRMFTTCEGPARANLRREIGALSEGVVPNLWAAPDAPGR